MFKLSQIFIGYTDGKKEAKFKENFEQYYYNYNLNYEKIMEVDKFLLLGKKGTGKSLLSEYINKNAMSVHDWFCNISSYKQFNFHELIHLKSREIKPNEYSLIWEWILLIEIARLVVTDQSADSNLRDKVLRFFESNNFTLKLDMNKVVDITKKGQINGTVLSKIFSLSGQFGKDTKYSLGSYLDYIDDFREVIIDLLHSTESKFTVIFDELDDKFRNEEIYKSNIISLIKVTDKLNTMFFDERVKCKLILLLRSDIFYKLNDPDLNKIEQDNSVKIDWGNVTNFNAPLFSLVFTKIKQSVESFKELSEFELYRKLFPQRIHSYFPDEFILGRTYFRPRDLVTYIRLYIEQFPDETFFSKSGIKAVEQKYSEYLLKEVKNEMYGHVSEVEINESFLLIKQFKKVEFTFDEIKTYLQQRTNIYKNIEIERSLKLLFDFSVIGNSWMGEGAKKPFYSWAYRENVEIDYDKKFVVHQGLRKELTL
ncbi:hypothetical protein [Paenibacillus sp. ACRRY]|uniref:P-loop ATPase, Sll1717 family n=1 Tax=Paenibacillus sp. ACRRY TaxID=2918208 RepID=UPI001EF419F4|nr:hypothetical protein [Paenibacillus sp. ACRRY]MCG7385595.1 hypothetical protein [Paenibacillus sp. ACRRY]